MEKETIDWSIFDKHDLSEVHCKCGTVYMSHTKLKLCENDFDHYSRKPCPGCGKDKNNMRKVLSGPIRETIRR